MSSPSSRTLPSRPDLAQQKKQAKELLQSFTAGDADARARVRAALPDKPRITLADAQFVLAREYGFPSWPVLREHIAARQEASRSPLERLHAAFGRRDTAAVRRILLDQPTLRARINDPLFPFNAPAIVHFAGDPGMVEVLLALGADPNRRSDWWAGPFHALHSATDASARLLLAAGAEVDACAAANLDLREQLARLIDENPSRVHERGGDGQTPLHFARSRAVVDLLLSAGADIDARDLDHRATPAEWMLARSRGAERYELARYLVERGASADLFLAAALGLTDRVTSMLEADPALLELRTGHGAYGERPPSSSHIYQWTIGANRSPLDAARQFGQEETVQAMLAFATPLQRLLLACRSGDETAAHLVLREHPGIVEHMSYDAHRAISDSAWEGNARAVAVMLALGFDPGTPGHDSGTALHCAAWNASLEIVAELLRHAVGRDLLARRDARYGATPLGWCCHGSRFGDTTRDHAAVATLLLDAGARRGPDTEEASDAVEAVLALYR